MVVKRYRRKYRRVSFGKASKALTRTVRTSGGVYVKKGYTLQRSVKLPLVLPESWMCRLKYAGEYSMDPAVGTIAITVFRANGLFDPEVALGGHQPRGFDQLMGLYNHFCVLGSRIRMVPVFQATVTPGYYGVTLSDDGTTIATYCATIADLQELEKTSRAKHAGYPNMINTSFNGATNWFSLKKFFKTKAIGDAMYRGDAATDPTEQAFFECWYSHINSNDPGATVFQITIEYIVKFTGPREIVRS